MFRSMSQRLVVLGGVAAMAVTATIGQFVGGIG